MAPHPVVGAGAQALGRFWAAARRRLSRTLAWMGAVCSRSLGSTLGLLRRHPAWAGQDPSGRLLISVPDDHEVLAGLWRYKAEVLGVYARLDVSSGRPDTLEIPVLSRPRSIDHHH